MKYVVITIAMIAVEVMLLAIAFLLLGNAVGVQEVSVDDSLFCGLIVHNNVGVWYCPMTLATQ
jgi:hypothetical protein